MSRRHKGGDITGQQQISRNRQEGSEGGEGRDGVAVSTGAPRNVSIVRWEEGMES